VAHRNGKLAQYALTSGELGSAGGQTLIAALLPVLLAPHAPSTFWIGAVIASEGAFALFLPYLAGVASDSLPPRFSRLFGPRGALLFVAMPIMAGALLLIPFRDSFWGLAGAAIIYFAALHAYSTPLRALLIDAAPRDRWGSVQGAMGATHLGGVIYGLVGGGLLFSIAEPLPFVVGAVLVLATSGITLTTAWRMDLGGTAQAEGNPGGNGVASGTAQAEGNPGGNGVASGTGSEWQPQREVRFWKDLMRRRETRQFLIANVLWNAGTEGIRPYLFLFATVVLGVAVQQASLAMLGFLVAAGVGSVLAGRFGDRIGRPRILVIGAVLAGVAMLFGFFVRDLLTLVLLLIPAGVGAAALVSLPYPVFESVVDEDDIGRSTGAFYMSVGVARITAPLLVGAAIDLAATWMPEQQGYPIMWPMAGTLILLGALVLQLTRRSGNLH
jgi:predicted MFS family arabinose efflux permease